MPVREQWKEFFSAFLSQLVFAKSWSIWLPPHSDQPPVGKMCLYLLSVLCRIFSQLWQVSVQVGRETGRASFKAKPVAFPFSVLPRWKELRHFCSKKILGEIHPGCLTQTRLLWKKRKDFRTRSSRASHSWHFAKGKTLLRCPLIHYGLPLADHENQNILIIFICILLFI